MVVVVVFYISGHGFGHASRDLELINALATTRPDVRVIVRSAAPGWLFDTPVASAASGVSRTTPRLDLQAFQADTGVVQVDSLRIDEDETVRQAALFYGDFKRRVEGEAMFLRGAGATIVLGDIPPIAFAAAARAGVPSVAVGNFTWDWIYRAYPAFDTLAPGVIGTIRDAYSNATRALRLPMHGGFEPMAAVTTDIPFIARRSTRDPADTRRALGIGSDRPFVLASTGGYGLQLAYDTIARSEHLTVVAPTRLSPAGISYQDLVAAADVVVSKPGYGIISECVAHGTALVFTSRGHFVEYDVLVAEMPRVLRCRYIPRDDLVAGRWAEAVQAVLEQPAPSERPRVDGAQVAANAILDLVNG